MTELCPCGRARWHVQHRGCRFCGYCSCEGLCTSSVGSDVVVVKAIQWAPSGNFLDGAPGPMLRLLADDGVTHGYGGGPGASMLFGSRYGDVQILPKQWVVRRGDGLAEVSDTKPVDL